MPALIKLGSRGADVERWQRLLGAAGFPVSASGDFDAETDRMTRAWQEQKHLLVDGKVGPQSWGAMTGEGQASPSTPIAAAALAGPDLGAGEAGTIADVRAAGHSLSERTTNLFRWLLLGVAQRLGASADHIAAVMASESAGTFSPSVRNPGGGATGLIQFMPATARRLGTTTDELAKMSAEEQLAYVEKYLRPFAGRMHSATDVYMAIFLPGFIGRPPSFVLGREGDETPLSGGLTYGQVYAGNRGFDHDHDGTITVGEVGATVEGILASAATRPRLEVKPEDMPGVLPAAARTVAKVGAGAGGLAILGALGWAIYRVLKNGRPW